MMFLSRLKEIQPARSLKRKKPFAGQTSSRKRSWLIELLIALPNGPVVLEEQRVDVTTGPTSAWATYSPLIDDYSNSAGGHDQEAGTVGIGQAKAKIIGQWSFSTVTNRTYVTYMTYSQLTLTTDCPIDGK